MLNKKHSRTNKTAVTTARADRPLPPSFRQRLFALFVLAITLLYTHQQQIFYNASLVLAAHLDYMQPRVNKISVLGNNNISTSELIALSKIRMGDALLYLDLQNIKAQLQTNGWVKNADIRRSINGSINITIQERVPQLVWQHNDEWYLIDRHGDKITTVAPEKAHGFLILQGRGANVGFNEIINALYALKLEFDVKRLIKINERRWDMILYDGLQVKLPSDNLTEALRHLPSIIALHSDMRPLSYIDLRVTPNKIYIKYQNNAK